MTKRLKLTVTYKGEPQSQYIGCASPVVTEEGPQVLKVGKLRSCHLWLDCPDNLVARMHAAMEIDDEGQVRVIDLGSFVGTRINGKKVDKSTKVAHGDKLSFGNFDVLVEHAQVREKPLSFAQPKQTVGQVGQVQEPARRAHDWFRDAQKRMSENQLEGLFGTRPPRAAQTDTDKIDKVLENLGDNDGPEPKGGKKHPFKGLSVVKRVRLTWHYTLVYLLRGARQDVLTWHRKGKKSPPPFDPVSPRRAKRTLAQIRERRRVGQAGAWAGERSALPYYTYVALFIVTGLFLPAAAVAVEKLSAEEAAVAANKADEPPVEVVVQDFDWQEGPMVGEPAEAKPEAKIDSEPKARRYRVRNKAMAEVEWSDDFDAVQERIDNLNAEHGDGSHWIEVQ